MGTKRLMAYINEATYWQKVELIRSTVVFPILLCLCYRKIIYAALMALDDIPLVYRLDSTHIHTTLEYNIFKLPPLPSTLEKEEGLAKAIIAFSTLIVVTVTIFGIFICIWEKESIQIISDLSLFPTLSSFQMGMMKCML